METPLLGLVTAPCYLRAPAEMRTRREAQVSIRPLSYVSPVQTNPFGEMPEPHVHVGR